MGGRNGGRADLDQIVEMRIAGGGIGEHELNEANDDGEVIAQKVDGVGIKRDRSAARHICTQF
ncbi:MAG TPA: hypothetical protein VN654_27135 [Vicinamibacterales bacterium]|nr:hypothetical protein [Vicinamibacterales bacterium]